MELDIQVSRDDTGQSVLTLSGAVDLVSKDELLGAGLREFDRAGVRALALDMAGVEFIDSSGLGALVTLDNEASSRGARFSILAPSVRVDRILELTGLRERLVAEG